MIFSPSDAAYVLRRLPDKALGLTGEAHNSMNDTKVREAGVKDAPTLPIEAEELLKALSGMETHGETVASMLQPFDKHAANLPAKDLVQLRRVLGRITSRMGACTALIDRISTTPEVEVGPGHETAAQEPTIVATPEDAMFPMDGFSDKVTGLPSRTIAEKAIESALNDGRPRFAAVFVLDRICHMSDRYGTNVGHQAIRHCALFLSQKLPPDSLLFRWRGAAYVALFDTSGAMSDAKHLMEQISIQKLKFNFMTNNRSAMVNLTASFLAISLAMQESANAVAAQVDQFIEGHSARQPH